MSANTTSKVELIVPPNEREVCLYGTEGASALQTSEALSKNALDGSPPGVVTSTPNTSQTSESNKMPSSVERTQEQPKVPFDPKVDDCVLTQFVTAAHSHASVGTPFRASLVTGASATLDPNSQSAITFHH